MTVAVVIPRRDPSPHSEGEYSDDSLVRMILDTKKIQDIWKADGPFGVTHVVIEANQGFK